jgi:hypothetical protein
MRRIFTVVFALALLTTASTATAQNEPDVSKRDKRGDARVPGATRAERAAIDVTRVKASSEPLADVLIVEVTFAGNHARCPSWAGQATLGPA